MFIQTEHTPNPATLKFLPGRDVTGAGTADFRDRAATGRSPLAEALFAVDEDERAGMIEHSASMRRVFTRRNQPIPLVGLEGGFFAVEPRTHVIRPARVEEFLRHGPYRDEPPAPAAG